MSAEDPRVTGLRRSMATLLSTQRQLQEARGQLGEAVDTHIDAEVKRQEVLQEHAAGTDNPLVHRELVETTGQIARLRYHRSRCP